MQTYKTILGLYILISVFGMTLGPANWFLFGMLVSPIIAIYSLAMFVQGHRSWYLLFGFLCGVAGIFMFLMLLAALAAFT